MDSVQLDIVASLLCVFTRKELVCQCYNLWRSLVSPLADRSS